MNRQSKPAPGAGPATPGEPARSPHRWNSRLLGAAAVAAALLAALPPASAQSRFGQTCMRSDAAAMPFERADASYEGTSAQQLMNAIAKELARPPSQVGGAYVFKAPDKVLVLWIRGQFVCNSGPFERALFDRVVRTVFGLDV